MIDADEARLIGRRAIAESPVPVDPEHEVVVWKLEEHELAWVVHVAARRWVRTRDPMDTLVGACPLVVDKESGELHRYGSSPVEYAKFTAWLDDEDPGAS